MSLLTLRLKNGFVKILDLIWPPFSLLSKQKTGQIGLINADEWVGLNFNFGPRCNICSIPLIDSPHPENTCPNCISDPPHFEKAAAPLIYDDISKPLILALKHSGRKDGINTYANWMIGSLKDREFDIIIPVPLHFSRLFEREFNQSIWLGAKIAKLTKVKFDRTSLIRIRKTKSQGTQSAKGRHRNIKNAFSCNRRLDGKRILLIDDVFTTGSTVNECARILKKNGAKSVIVLTLLRVNALSVGHIETEALSEQI